MCMACTTSLDAEKTEAFAERMLELVSGGALSLMISVGHRTRLFDAMSQLEHATSEEIASKAGLNERYVREWLGAMVTGRIVENDPATDTYRLPAEHGKWLTRSSSPDNFAVTTQFIPLLGTVEDEIVECFSKGGGVPYSSYDRFHQIMAEESSQTVVAGLEEHLLDLVPGLKERLESGIDVLDIGCGSGRAMNWLAKRFPKSRFRGYDFEADAIAIALAEATTTNVEFRVKDVSLMDERNRYDLITAFDAIHDQAHPADVLAAIQRALKADGTFLMQDIKGHTPHHMNLKNPLAPLMYTISCMHCMTVSLAGGGAGLGAMWGREKAEEMLVEAGFTRTEIREMPHDIINYWYIVRKD
ncbi:MAG: class I SAM-dependent methyltransferase [Planctomycetota bacterium]